MRNKMNEFENRAHALRQRYRAERAQMWKACERHVGHLNIAIGQTSMPEAKEALRDEKKRVREATLQSMAWHKRHYLNQVEALNDQYRLHLEKNPSGRALRRTMA